jgi:hypothetical protein
MKYYFAIDIKTTDKFMNKCNDCVRSSIVDMKEVENFIAFMSVPNGREWKKNSVSMNFGLNKKKCCTALKSR